MGRIAYFIADRKSAHPDEFGIGYAFESAPTIRETNVDGRQGILLSDTAVTSQEKSSAVVYRMKEYTGEDIHEDVYLLQIGSIEPCDLIRKEIRPGEDIILGDGHQWSVPKAFVYGDDLERVQVLPSVITYKDGEAIAQVRKEFHEIFSKAWNIADEIFSGKVVYDVDFSVDVLSLNYRVGKAEVAILEIFHDSSVLDVIKVFIDFENALGIGKKKMAETEN